MNDPILIRPASPTEMDEAVAIDDDACVLYERAGLHVDLTPEHPFARAEHAKWALAAREGNAFFAVTPDAKAVGMLIMSRVAGAPHLEQLSVRTSAMRRGIGRQLLAHAIEWAGREPLWLTTYAHLPWNRPFYERAGFTVVPERECPPDIVLILADQRRWLPAPGERIAMRRDPDSGKSPQP